jgi:hypothetical protein
MNFNFGGLSDLLFESQPDKAPDAKVPPAVQPTPSTAPTPIAVRTPIMAPLEVAGQTEATKVEAFVKILRDKLAAAPEAETLNSFMTLFTSLAEDLPDEAKRFRAALRALEKTEGISQLQFQAALEKMLQYLEIEGTKFAGQVNQQIANNVTNREQSIAKLNADIEALEKQRDDLAVELVGARNDVATVQASFKAASQEIGQEINDSLNRLRIYSTVAKTTA